MKNPTTFLTEKRLNCLSIQINDIDDFAMEEELDYEPQDDWDDDNDLIVNVSKEDMFESEDESFQSKADVEKVISTLVCNPNPRSDSKKMETSDIVATSGDIVSNSEEACKSTKVKSNDPPLKFTDSCSRLSFPRFPYPRGKSYPNMLPMYTPPRIDYPPPNRREFLNHLPRNNKASLARAPKLPCIPPAMMPIMRHPPPVIKQSRNHVPLTTVQSPSPPPYFKKLPSSSPSTFQSSNLLPPAVQSNSSSPPSVQSSRPLTVSSQPLSIPPPSIHSPSILPPSKQLPESLPLKPSMKIPSPGKQPACSQLTPKATESPDFLPLTTFVPSNPPPPPFKVSPNLPSTLLSRVRERLSSPSPPMVSWHKGHIMKEVQRGLEMSTAILSWHLYHACAGFKEKSVSRLSDRFKAVQTLQEVELEDTVGTSEGGGQLSQRFGCLALENQNKVVVVGKRKREDDLPLNMKQKIMRRLGVKQEGDVRVMRRERFGEVDMNFFDNVKYLSDKWRK